MNSTLSDRFVIGGLRFFAASFILGSLLLLFAPLDVLRAFCALALVGSIAGFTLHLAALREMDPEAVPAFRARAAAALRRARALTVDAMNAIKGPAQAGREHVARPAVDATDVAD